MTSGPVTPVVTKIPDVSFLTPTSKVDVPSVGEESLASASGSVSSPVLTGSSGVAGTSVLQDYMSSIWKSHGGSYASGVFWDIQ